MAMTSLNLAAIGNCTVASLITPQGSHVWHCFPRLDGDPVFNALLGAETDQAGCFDVVMRNFAKSEQRYLPNTAIVETVLKDTAGQSLRMLDFRPRYRRFGRMFRPPMIVRRIEPIAGRPLISLRIRPTFGYGERPPEITLGSNHARFVADDLVLRVTTDMPVSYTLHETQLALDRPINVFLGPDETLPDNPDSLARTFLGETTSYWQDWVRDLNVPFDWQEAVIRAAITLKLCSFDDTGAIVAALTTSVPEAGDSTRNWDYRFCWLRDAFFTVTALNRLSATRTMEAFVRFVLDSLQREDHAPILPLLAVAPGMDPSERLADSLAGYRGIGPVRIGNAAVLQRQNDVYGSIVLTAAQMFWDLRLPLQGDVSLYRQLCEVGHLAASAALEQDAGFW